MQVKENQNLISLLAFFDWAAAESKYNAYTLETNNILRVGLCLI